MVFTIGKDQFLKRRKKGRMGEGIALYARKDRLGERFGHIAKRLAAGLGGVGVFNGHQDRVIHHGQTLTFAVGGCDLCLSKGLMRVPAYGPCSATLLQTIRATRIFMVDVSVISAN